MTLSFYTAILPIPPRSWVNSSMYAIPCLPILRHRLMPGAHHFTTKQVFVAEMRHIFGLHSQ
jgi:hypothetical protein